MKKILWIIGGLFFAFLVAIISIPLFVDVDQYRPTIVAEANKRINGKLELGHLKLSLWGTIKIHADSIRLTVNGFPEPMLDTKQFHLQIPILSLFSGSPQVVAVLEAPKISVVKELNGKMNALELMKTAEAETPSNQTAITDSLSAVSASADKKAKPSAPAAAAAPPAEANTATSPTPATAPIAPAATPAEPTKVPAIVAGARLGLRIKEGDLNYNDKITKSTYQVVGLDLDAKNLGLGSAMDISVKAPVKGSSPTMTFDGPITADAQLKPNLVGNNVKSVSGKIDLDATQLKVEMKGGVFRKTDAMPLKLHADFDGSDRETLLKALDLQFADYKIHGKGRITAEPMAAKVNLSTDPGNIRLEKVQNFVPMAEAYQLKGVADFNADIDWKPEALKASGDLKVTDGSFFMKDTLKAPMQFRMQAGFSENSLSISRAALSGPETEIEMVGNVKNFLAPQFTIAITGKSFNVDKTLVLPAGAAPAKTSQLFNALIPLAYAEPKTGDVNPMLAMAKNPTVANALGTLTAQIAKVVVYGASLEQVTAKAQLQNMLLKLVDASLKSFGGSVKSTGEFDLKTAGLNYRSQGNVMGISAREAFKTYFPKYERTLEGNVDANWNIVGAAFPASTRMRTIRGTAKLIAKDGAVKSVDFQDSINNAMSKIPFLKNQKPVTIDNGFKTLTADVNLENGIVRAEPIEIHPRNQGFVIKGKSTIQESLEQETFLDVYDPQGQLPKQLQSPGKPAIALRITGPITSPQTDYGYTVRKLADSAGKTVVKEEGIKALGRALGIPQKEGQSDQDKLKEAADALKRKFKF